MNLPNVPAHGATVIFDRVPNSSWARVGEAYRVLITGANKGARAQVHLKNIARGSMTCDSANAYRSAIWHTV